MRGAVMYAPGDVRVEERDDPKILYPTDAVIRLSATCICGSGRRFPPLLPDDRPFRWRTGRLLCPGRVRTGTG